MMISYQEPEFGFGDVADLKIIDYQKLLVLDPLEQCRAVKACEDRGFFILRLKHAGNMEIWDQAKKTFAVAKQAFSVTEDEKDKFHMALSGTSELSGHVTFR